jgi:signal transduction histidine kinase
VLGAIYVDNHASSAPFSAESLKAVEALARHAALAIENVRLFEREERALDELRMARDLAFTANRAKSAFLSNMSHELHTPLNAIIGYAEMVQEKAEELGQKELIPDLARIREAGRHLLRLIDDVLEISRLEDGEMTLHLRSLDLAALLREVVAGAEPLARVNGNTLAAVIPDDLGVIRSDPDRVHQVVAKLLSNAAKFTERGQIRIEARRSFRAGRELVEIDVTDSGIGMSRDQAAALFQPFTQADSSPTRKYGGTGLGLAICKRICDRLGGRLSVGSEPGQGSRLALELPIRPEDGPIEAAALTPTRQAV